MSASDTASASTETLSDLETRVEVFAPRGGKYNESYDPEDGASDSQPDPEVDSEATVSDVEVWESGSDNAERDAGCLRQPAQRLTARQIARQERLLQGIHQTRWDDMQLPRGLDLTHKTKQKTAASEEQHLKKMKAAEVRRVRTQKARKDTMEITKARIRAATSKNFRDMVENNQTTKGKVAKTEKRFTPGTIRIKRRPDESIVILPPEAPLPHALTPRSATGYPHKRVRCELLLDSDFRTDEISLGMQLTIRSKDSKSVAMKGDLALGFVKSVNGAAMDDTSATLTTIWRRNGIPHSIGIALDASKSDT